MFEVTYNAKQRKNYLVYCLYYLMKNYDTDTFGQKDYVDYVSFVENLAKQYFFDVYLNVEKLIDKEPKNEDDSLDIDKHDFEYKIYTSPRPGSFDEIIIPKLLNQDGYSNFGKCTKRSLSDFYNIYGDGISKYDTGFDSKILTHKSNGIPLFVFNYLDYLIWDCFKTNDNFWDTVGCTKFENDGNINFNIDNFYFSNTRKSLEHFYPQANAKGGDALNETQINCFGNFGMIGSEANSSGSNFEPYAKLKTYLSRSSKISRVSVSSLKFLIMMKICDSQNKDIPYEKKWFFDEIQEHQKKMLALLGLKNSDNERNDKKLCKDVMKKLLCELGTYLVEACKKKTQLNSECECDFSNLNDMIKEYYDSNKQSYPKVFVEIKRVEGIRILLNIEIESDLYYGICFTDDRWKNLSNQKDKILKAFDNDSWKNLVKKNNKDAPFWVWFRNLPSEEIHLNFRKCNEYYMNLLDETKYEEMKKRIIKEIDDNLDNILKFGVPKSLM